VVKTLSIKKTVAWLIIVSTLALLAYTITVYYGEILPTIPTKQLIEVTTTTRLLSTNDSFANFVLNMRLADIVFYAIFTSLLLSPYIRRDIRNIILFIVFILVSTITCYDLCTGNPYHTLPRNTNDYIEAYLLLLLSILNLSLVTYIYVRKNLGRNMVFSKESILLVTPVIAFLLLSFTLYSGYIVIDHVITYVLLYIVLTTLLAILGVNRS